ncbi:FtsW/RodA/SpoVE family cell cycle protein [Enterococcus sp. HY326]|uniref:FtsW/RodA/SpoVE family cell cycle protein n=1 Tax=Enterococcus sp. HY326 TaxID=2971265 RepID=UPI00223E9D8D|nr:FtsW/RodA/SpoVE family cell cycle protein [Enterococcus sp. HY326]
MSKIKKRHFLDYGILIPYIILCVLGLLMVYSTTSISTSAESAASASDALKQLAFWIISLVAIFFIYRLKIDVLKNQRMIILAIAVMVFLLVLVLFMDPVNGARGWITIPGGLGTIQPAEYFKVVVIWYLAFVLSRRQEMIQKDFKQSINRPLLMLGALTLLIVIQPDLGNTAIIVLLMMIMVLASGINYWYSIIIGLGGILASVGVIQFVLHFGENIIPQRWQYVYDRFAIFSNPFVDDLNTGHQLANGYYAMFNGGLFGLGLGNSIQKRGFLSEAQTDYIFAILMEELGLIVALLVLALLIFMIARILLVGIRARSPFNSLMCIGIASLFIIQIFINLGGISGIIPLTGITFPFISQGGSSLLCLSICVGIALNISADEKRQRFMEDIQQQAIAVK